MAKKEETVSLIDTFSEFKELKNIDRTTWRVRSIMAVTANRPLVVSRMVYPIKDAYSRLVEYFSQVYQRWENVAEVDKAVPCRCSVC